MATAFSPHLQQSVHCVFAISQVRMAFFVGAMSNDPMASHKDLGHCLLTPPVETCALCVFYERTLHSILVG